MCTAKEKQQKKQSVVGGGWRPFPTHSFLSLAALGAGSKFLFSHSPQTTSFFGSTAATRSPVIPCPIGVKLACLSLSPVNDATHLLSLSSPRERERENLASRHSVLAKNGCRRFSPSFVAVCRRLSPFLAVSRRFSPLLCREANSSYL